MIKKRYLCLILALTIFSGKASTCESALSESLVEYVNLNPSSAELDEYRYVFDLVRDCQNMRSIAHENLLSMFFFVAYLGLLPTETEEERYKQAVYYLYAAAKQGSREATEYLSLAYMTGDQKLKIEKDSDTYKCLSSILEGKQILVSECVKDNLPISAS